MRTSQICPTCTTYINSLCVVYNGTYLSNINVSPLDDLDTLLSNINIAVGVINGSIATLNTSVVAINNNIVTLSNSVVSGLALKEDTANKSNGPLGTSSILFPTESSVSTALIPKENISDKVTTQATFISNGTSVIKYPAIKAVKDYVDGVTTGLLRDNGNYNPTITSQYPTSANTLSGLAPQKGDLWYISVNGTMNGNAVLVGYSVRALVNGAGPTTNADWAIANVGLGFVPENSANKSTDGTFNSGVPSTTLFPTQSAVATYFSTHSSTLNQVLTAGNTSTTSLVIGDTLVTPSITTTLSPGILQLQDLSVSPLGTTVFHVDKIVIDNATATNQMVINYNNNNQTIDFPSGSGTLALAKYKVYTAIASWGVGGLTTTVLENTLGATITWADAFGTMTGTASSGVFTNNKTVFIIGSYFAGNNSYNNVCRRVNTTTLNLFSINTANGSQASSFNQTFTLEIRVYL